METVLIFLYANIYFYSVIIISFLMSFIVHKICQVESYAETNPIILLIAFFLAIPSTILLNYCIE